MEAPRRVLPGLEPHRFDTTESIPHITATRFELTVTQRSVSFSFMDETPDLHPKWSCWLCGKPVSLEACKTDEYGQSVHERCYVARLALEKASAQWVAQNALHKSEAAAADH